MVSFPGRGRRARQHLVNQLADHIGWLAWENIAQTTIDLYQAVLGKR